LSDPAEVIFYPDTVPALRRLADRFQFFIVTNQSGVAKGTISLAAVERVNAHVAEFLAEHGITITETYVCPHLRADGCDCIKPKPYFLQASSRRYGIDLTRSFVIGDHPHDIEFAAGVGAVGIYVLTGHGRKHQAELPPDTVVADGIRQAADYISAHQAM